MSDFEGEAPELVELASHVDRMHIQCNAPYRLARHLPTHAWRQASLRDMDEWGRCMRDSGPLKVGCELCSSNKAQHSIATGNTVCRRRGKRDRIGSLQSF